jgi:hypothetical protein
MKSLCSRFVHWTVSSFVDQCATSELDGAEKERVGWGLARARRRLQVSVGPCSGGRTGAPSDYDSVPNFKPSSTLTLADADSSVAPMSTRMSCDVNLKSADVLSRALRDRLTHTAAAASAGTYPASALTAIIGH